MAPASKPQESSQRITARRRYRPDGSKVAPMKRQPVCAYPTVPCTPLKEAKPAYQPVLRGRGPKPGGTCMKQQPSPAIAYL